MNLYNNKIARTVLPIRNIGLSEDVDKVVYFDSNHLIAEDIPNDRAIFVVNGNARAYWIWHVATAWVSDSQQCVSAEDQNAAWEKIYRAEDIAFLNGWEGTDIDGICATNIVRYDVSDAIKEFEPRYFITSSDLKPSGVDTLRTDLLEDGVHYLAPKDPCIAEFVISQDIEYEEPSEVKKFDRSSLKWIGAGKWKHEIGEWATIEIHYKDNFVKVIT